MNENIMKKNVITLLSIIISIATQAQTEIKSDADNKETNEIQTLFNHSGPVGWWISPDFAYTQIDGRNAFLGGMSGGIIIDHSFSVGLAGYGIMNSQNLNYIGINDTAEVYLYGGYGGLKLEYRIYPVKMINLAFPLLIGGGGVAYSTWGQDDWNNFDHHENYDYTYAWDSFFVIEPGVVVGLNLLKFMRLDAGVSYRYAPGIELPKTDSKILNSFNANISLKFGKF
jgi:hypothetical protein